MMVLVFLALQAVLVGVYFLIEKTWEPAELFVAERLDEPAPPLSVEGRRGTIDLATLKKGPVVVHFWATWCVPCRKEPPGLLEAARDAGLPILAVTDEEWPAVERFFGGMVPEEVVRDPGGVGARAFRVAGLPDTFVVDGGRVVARVGGARDWEREEGRRFLGALGGGGGSW